MDGARFDAITRQFGKSLTRRRFLGGVAGAAAAAALPRHFASAQATDDDATSTVQQFYQYVDAYDYASAYALLGSDWQQSQSETAFTNGYGDTAFVDLVISGTEDGENGATHVNVELTSWHNDGSVHAYSGYYVVGNEGSNTLMLDASIAPTTAPDVAPLCTLDDLSFAFAGGDAGAGSRFGSIVGTNSGDSACVLGGSPRLILRDQSTGNRLVSTSEAGSPPAAIVVQPGESGTAPYRFSNWCGAHPPQNFTVSVEVPGDNSDGTIEDGLDTISFPPCLGSGESALLGVQGWTAS
jgi:hypothetical protein